MFVDVSDTFSVNLNNVFSIEIAEQMIGSKKYSLIFTSNTGHKYAYGNLTKQQARELKDNLVQSYNAIFLPPQEIVLNDVDSLFYNVSDRKIEGNR